MKYAYTISVKNSIFFPFFNQLINFEAEDWTQLLDTTKLKPRFKTVPPLLSLFSMKELEESIGGGPVTLPEIPCHSQHVIIII